MDVARALGVKFGPVEIVEIQDPCGQSTRGIFAEQDLPVGTLVVEAPSSACFDVASARQTLPSWAEDLSDEAAIGLSLALLRREGCVDQGTTARAAWVASLPSIATSLHWSDDDLKVLEGSSFHEVARSYREETDTEWSFLSESPDAAAWTAEKGLSCDDLRWGKGIVTSRQLQTSEDQKCIVMPGIDLLNHSNEPNAECNVDAGDSKVIAIKTTVAVKKGQEVVVSYGPHPNASLLIFYGFALPPPNPYDCLEVLLQLPVKPGRVAAVRALAERYGESDAFHLLAADEGGETIVTRHSLFAAAGRLLPPELFAVFQLQVSNEELTEDQVTATRASLRNFLNVMVTARAPLPGEEELDGLRGSLARARRAEREIAEAAVQSLDALSSEATS